MKPNILLVDDNPETLEALCMAILSFGYLCDTATNGEDALSKIQNAKYQVLITDLIMPLMNGIELIENVKKVNDEILCLIISGDSDVEMVISALSQHKAYDFLLKPFSTILLKNRIDKALEVYQLKEKIKTIVISEDEHFRQIIEIFDWKKELQKKQYESLASKIIRQINIGLFHGGGFGGLLSVLSIIFSKLKMNSESKKYELSENQYNLLKENYDSAKNLVNGFNKAQTILMDNAIFSETIRLNELFKILEKIRERLKPMLKIKNQKLSVSSIPNSASQYEIIFQKERMEMAITELLLNAMKYSGENDQIYIILFIKEKHFEIKFLNPAYKNQDDSFGISGANEQMIFEPFYRLSPVSYEGYYLEEFGAGIGLSVVKKIIEQHGAEINIFTIKNFLTQGDEKDVSVSIRFPLQSVSNKLEGL